MRELITTFSLAYGSQFPRELNPADVSCTMALTSSRHESMVTRIQLTGVEDVADVFY